MSIILPRIVAITILIAIVFTIFFWILMRTLFFPTPLHVFLIIAVAPLILAYVTVSITQNAFYLFLNWARFIIQSKSISKFVFDPHLLKSSTLLIGQFQRNNNEITCILPEINSTQDIENLTNIITNDIKKAADGATNKIYSNEFYMLDPHVRRLTKIRRGKFTNERVAF